MPLNKQFILNTLVIFLLISATVPLRFINLGYSEFQDDEKKAFMRVLPDENVFEFFIRQRKGPMQFLVTQVPYLITHDYRNEFAERFPFAVLNTASVILLYLLLLKITKNKLASFFGALIYSTNGFIVGFSRIAQYQNLNLFFSFLALYFYYDLTTYDRHLIRKSLIATFAFSLSLLSHWDAIFYLVPIVYFFILFLRRKDLDKKYKNRIILWNFSLGSLLILPFLIPYFMHHSNDGESARYFVKRFGFNKTNIIRHKFIFELYNPFITLYLYGVFLVLSLFFIKKHFAYFLWFGINFGAILFFMAKPGTHIYNYIIPLVFIFSLLAGSVLNKFSMHTQYIFGILTLSIFALLFYQSYVVFVDHTRVYPWDSKIIFGRATTPYVDKEVLTFGFPHFRDWKNINSFLLNYNKDCGYITNEGKEISQIYLDLTYGDTTGCHYIINVKRPFISTRDGVVFPSAKKKIYQYEVRGEWLTRVYGRKL